MAILVGVLACSTAFSLYLCWDYVHKAAELRSLQMNATAINQRRAAVTSLANDAIEYGQKNPAILPVLEAAGLKPPSKSAATVTNKPSK